MRVILKDDVVEQNTAWKTMRLFHCNLASIRRVA